MCDGAGGGVELPVREALAARSPARGALGFVEDPHGRAFLSPGLADPPAGGMTSLAQQLQRLALPQSDPSLLSRDEVASLLFDPKEAATIDRDTAFAIGELPFD